MKTRSQTNPDSCVVLVTGAAGFLGQHVVGLLQTKADHVTEIRVLDTLHYQNRLDYVHTKPLQIFTGSVTDHALVTSALSGVHCVIHLAAIADSRMFPDEKKINEVNVNGTICVLLAAMQSPTVKRFIFCSSMSVSMDYENRKQNIDIPNTYTTETPLFEIYASSKLAGEQITRAANGADFKTVCVRPLLMYGELDTTYISKIIQIAASCGGTLYQVNCGDTKHQCVYVGNVAWTFVCAEKTLYEETKTSFKTDVQRNNVADDGRQAIMARLEEIYQNTDSVQKKKDITNYWCSVRSTPSDKSVFGQAFFAADDTPKQNMFSFQKPYIIAAGFRHSRLVIPHCIVMAFLYAIYFLLTIMNSCFGLQLNCSTGIPNILYMTRTFHFNDQSTRALLNYKPLYSPEESLRRSIDYYRSLGKTSK